MQKGQNIENILGLYYILGSTGVWVARSHPHSWHSWTQPSGQLAFVIIIPIVLVITSIIVLVMMTIIIMKILMMITKKKA